MATQTNMFPASKLVHSTMHLLEPLAVSDEPSLRAVDVDIVSENIAIAVHDPRIAANDRAAGYELPTDGSTVGRDDALVHRAEGGMHAKGLLDAGGEVGEGVGICEEGWVDHYRSVVVGAGMGFRQAGFEFGLEFEIA